MGLVRRRKVRLVGALKWGWTLYSAGSDIGEHEKYITYYVIVPLYWKLLGLSW